MSISVETIQSGTGIDVKATGKNASQGGSSEGSFIGILMQIFGTTSLPEDATAGVKTGLVSPDGTLTEEGAQVLSDVEASLLSKNVQPAAGAATAAGMKSMSSALSRIAVGQGLSITGEDSGSDAPVLTDQTIKDDLSSDAVQSVLVSLATGPTGPSSTVVADNDGIIQNTATSAGTNTGTAPLTAGPELLTTTGAAFLANSLASLEFDIASTGKNEESVVTQDKSLTEGLKPLSKENEPEPAGRISPEFALSVMGKDQTQSPLQQFTMNNTPSAGSAEVSGTATIEPSQLMDAAGTHRAESEGTSKAVGGGRIISLQVEGGEQLTQPAGVSAAATALSLTGAAAKAGVKIETVQQTASQQAVAIDEDRTGTETVDGAAESSTVSVQSEELSALKKSKKALSNETAETPDRSVTGEVTTADRDKKTGSIKTEGASIVRHGDQTGGAGNVSSLTAKSVEAGEIKPQVVIQQVVDGVTSSIGKDSGRIRIELTPPNLGTLNLDLVVTQDHVKMVILADNQDVRNLLQSNMEQLKTSLQQQGIKTDAINVFVQDRLLSNSNGNPGGNWGGQHAWHFQGQMQDGSNSGNAFAWGTQETALEGDTDDPLSNLAWRASGSGVHIVA